MTIWPSTPSWSRTPAVSSSSSSPLKAGEAWPAFSPAAPPCILRVIRHDEDIMAPQDTRPRLKAPPGACDTHMHFYDDRFPMAPTALLKPPPATVPEYRRLQQRLGLSRTVIVQPSTYGTDNSCTLEAMAALGANARGVPVVDTSATNAEVEPLTKAA